MVRINILINSNDYVINNNFIIIEAMVINESFQVEIFIKKIVSFMESLKIT